MLFHIDLKSLFRFDSDGDGGWVAFVPGTSIRVYADTEEAVNERLVKAVRLGLNALYSSGGVTSVKAYLDKHSIPYLVSDDDLVTVTPVDDKALLHAS